MRAFSTSRLGEMLERAGARGVGLVAAAAEVVNTLVVLRDMSFIES
jgi:hypothetical protein